jgi:dihydrofolate reductase
MIISLIAAMAENRVIGYRNSIPWHISSDQKRFRAITLGHAILLGRVTFEIIGHSLAGRNNIVLTRQKRYQAPGAVVVHSLEEAFAACKGEEELFVSGGGTVFQETIDLADRIYLSIIHRDYKGDSFFPEIPGSFKEVSREEMQETPPYSFVRYQRKTR